MSYWTRVICGRCGNPLAWCACTQQEIGGHAPDTTKMVQDSGLYNASVVRMPTLWGELPAHVVVMGVAVVALLALVGGLALAAICVAVMPC